MRQTGWDIARSALVRLLVAGSFLFVLVYLFIAIARVNYPFELEWIEGCMSEHVRRILAGQPIYARPSLEFTSLLYPPLYYEAAAAMAKILGPGFLPLRLLSLLSSVGVFALIYQIVRRESGAAFPGMLAMGLYAATYDRVGGWFDLARLDSFYLLVLLASVNAQRFSTSRAGAIVAGLFMGAACLTKQSAIVVAIPLAVYCILADSKRAPFLIGGAAGVVLGGALFLDRSSGGWFHYYCFYLPMRHPRTGEGILAFWKKDLVPVLPIAALAASVHVARRFRPGQGRKALFFPLLAGGMISSSWAVRTMVGAEVNDLMPAYAAVSMLAPMTLHEILRRAADARPGRWAPAAVLTLGLFAAQFVMLGYNPTKYLPTAADREAGTKLVARIARIPGDVFVPHHGYLATLAGKKSFAHAIAIDNLRVEDDGPVRRDLEREIVDALEHKRFAAVLIESDRWHADDILRNYRAEGFLFDNPDVFWPVTGARLRPEILCVRR